jgi:starch synthase
VPFDADPTTGFPSNPDKFARDLAVRIKSLMADPEQCKRFGAAGRKRVEEKFGWPAIAKQTAELYRNLCEGEKKKRG